MTKPQFVLAPTRQLPGRKAAQVATESFSPLFSSMAPLPDDLDMLDLNSADFEQAWQDIEAIETPLLAPPVLAPMSSSDEEDFVEPFRPSSPQTTFVSDALKFSEETLPPLPTEEEAASEPFGALLATAKTPEIQARIAMLLASKLSDSQKVRGISELLQGTIQIDI
jgi:hypothetical protein